MNTGRVTIDGKVVDIDGANNLLELIRKTGIKMPTFCYHSELSIYGACRLCSVELENRGVVASCSTPPEDGMVVKTNTERTRKLKKMILELLLANHDRECPTCDKSGSCKLQTLAKQFGVNEIRFGSQDEKLPLDKTSLSITKDPNKCILCGDCVRMCKEVQGIGVWDFAYRGSKTQVTTAFQKSLADVDCVNCGQCAAVCPTGALTIKSDVDKAWTDIFNPEKTVIVQVAPAVRVALGEEFNLDAGEVSTGKMVSAIKKLGVDKVFDTVFAADMTTIEESTEFLERLEKGDSLPQFTSCCPAWIKYCEQFHADLLNNVSSCRSPQQMFGSVIKKQYAETHGLKPENISCISIMPCTAKKYEASREEFKTENQPDVDVVLTTIELAQMIKESGIVFDEIEPEAFDNPLGMGSGAGLIFGATGGVTESVVRYVAGQKGGSDTGRIDFEPVRGLEGIKEAQYNVNGIPLKMAVVHGLANAEKLISEIKKGNSDYHIIEVMSCPGGCIGGAGQPGENNTENRIRRMRDIYNLDAVEQIHRPQDNMFVNKLLNEWMGGPGSHKAHNNLHTNYIPRRRISGGKIEMNLAEEEQMNVYVCVGTGCYLKGSYDVLEKFMEMTKQLNLENKINLQGTFCLEHCDEGVSVKVDDEIITGITWENAEEIFKKRIALKVEPPLKS